MPSTSLLSDLLFVPFKSSFISQMFCLFSSNLAILFWDFYKRHHSTIYYVLYFDKALPETIPFYTLHSAYSWSPHNLKKPLIGMVQHLESKSSPGCLLRVNTQSYLPREKWQLPQSLLSFLLPSETWILSGRKTAHVSVQYFQSHYVIKVDHYKLMVQLIRPTLKWQRI